MLVVRHKVSHDFRARQMASGQRPIEEVQETQFELPFDGCQSILEKSKIDWVVVNNPDPIKEEGLVYHAFVREDRAFLDLVEYTFTQICRDEIGEVGGIKLENPFYRWRIYDSGKKTLFTRSSKATVEEIVEFLRQDGPKVLSKEQERENIEEEARATRQAEEIRQKIKDGNNVLRQWAEANGSPLLRERVFGGFEWIGLAEHEFCASVLARANLSSLRLDEGEEDMHYDVLPRTTPSLESIKALRAVREALGALSLGVNFEVGLVWTRATCCCDHCDETHDWSREQIRVRFVCPNRSVRDYFLTAD